jgi:hypothetical protein
VQDSVLGRTATQHTKRSTIKETTIQDSSVCHKRGRRKLWPPVGAISKHLGVSADPTVKPASHTRAESRGSRPSKGDAGERRTVRWREMDSNPRSPERATSVFKRPVRRIPPSSTRRNEGSPASASAAPQADRVFSSPITLMELPWPVRLTRLHRQRIVALLSGAATSCGTGNIRSASGNGEGSGRPDLRQQVNQDLDRHNQQEGERRAEQKDGGDDRPCGPSSKTTHRVMSRSIDPGACCARRRKRVVDGPRSAFSTETELTERRLLPFLSSAPPRALIRRRCPAASARSRGRAFVKQLVSGRVHRWLLDPGNISKSTSGRLEDSSVQRRLLALAADIGNHLVPGLNELYETRARVRPLSP